MSDIRRDNKCQQHGALKTAIPLLMFDELHIVKEKLSEEQFCSPSVFVIT